MENLNKYKEQKTSLADVIGALEQNLAAVQFPLNAARAPRTCRTSFAQP